MAAAGIERPRVPQTNDPEGAWYLNCRLKYLAKMGLQEHMETLCQRLLSAPRIPRNPYPGFVQHLRQQGQRTILEGYSSVQGLVGNLNVSSHQRITWAIAGAGAFSSVWGLPSLLRCVCPESVAQYTWLINDVTLPLSSFRNARPYTVQVLPALTGPCIFSGTFFQTPHSVDVLQILVVIGPDVERAVSIYCQSILEDLARLIEQRRHLVYRVCVPVDEGGKLEVFSEVDTRTRAAELRACVLRAVHCQKQVRVECLWRLDPTGTHFQRGSKCYDLSVIQTSQGLQRERVVDFSGCPLKHLFSSLFLQRSHAEAYIGLFVPREEVGTPHLLPPEAAQAAFPTCGTSLRGSFLSGTASFTLQTFLQHTQQLCASLPASLCDRDQRLLLLGTTVSRVALLVLQRCPRCLS